MSTFTLGQRVRITGYTEARYKTLFRRIYRFWGRIKLEQAKEGIIVRRSWKRGGLVHPGGGPDRDGDWTAASLEVKKQYLTYEVATNLHHKALVVSAKDIEAIV